MQTSTAQLLLCIAGEGEERGRVNSSERRIDTIRLICKPIGFVDGDLSVAMIERYCSDRLGARSNTPINKSQSVISTSPIRTD